MRIDLYEKINVKINNYLIENCKNKGEKYIQNTIEELDRLIEIYFEEIGIKEIFNI